MVGMAVLMLFVAWWCAWAMWRRRGELAAMQLRVLSWMTFAGWIATIAGWWVTEIGRQPFLVYGLLRTADLVGDHETGTVLASLVAYLALYAFLLVSYVRVLVHMASQPAQPTGNSPESAKPALPVGGPA